MPDEFPLPDRACFIGAWFIDELGVCDELIGSFFRSTNKHPGAIGDRSGRWVVNLEEKESIEIQFPAEEKDHAFVSYVAELQKIVSRYIERYPMCNQYAPWTIVEPTNLQYYPPGGGYKIFHTERTRAIPPVCNRHLVFMTYLNTVNDAGETEFFHQRISVPPRKGLTLIWPADWTFTHRGIISPTEEKFVITGWFNYYVPA